MKPPSEIVSTVKCANCGAMKQKSNNWWMIYRLEDSGAIAIMPMIGEIANDIWYLCGVACVQATVNDYMSDRIKATHTTPVVLKPGAGSIPYPEKEIEPDLIVVEARRQATELVVMDYRLKRCRECGKSGILGDNTFCPVCNSSSLEYIKGE
jgi:hypothetical protein